VSLLELSVLESVEPTADTSSAMGVASCCGSCWGVVVGSGSHALDVVI
jgi:hypothetical protein